MKKSIATIGAMMAMVGVSSRYSPAPRRRPQQKDSRSRVIVGEMIRMCPGGKHAWFESNVGPIKKPATRPEGYGWLTEARAKE